jgi:hypothetical protein
MPVILATQEVEMRRISHHGQIVCEYLSQKNPTQNRLVEWFKV